MVAQLDEKEDTLARITILGRIVGILNKVVDPISGKVGASIAAVILFAMMLITFADVIGRGIFNKPIMGTLEITEYMMGVMVAFAIAYMAFWKGHIRVDIVLQFVSRRVKVWMDILAYGMSAVFFALIAWQTWLYVWSVRSDNLTSSVLSIPTYPFVLLVSIGAGFAALVFFRDFLDAINKVKD